MAAPLWTGTRRDANATPHDAHRCSLVVIVCSTVLLVEDRGGRTGSYPQGRRGVVDGDHRGASPATEAVGDHPVDNQGKAWSGVGRAGSRTDTSSTCGHRPSARSPHGVMGPTTGPRQDDGRIRAHRLWTGARRVAHAIPAGHCTDRRWSAARPGTVPATEPRRAGPEPRKVTGEHLRHVDPHPCGQRRTIGHEAHPRSLSAAQRPSSKPAAGTPGGYPQTGRGTAGDDRRGASPATAAAGKSSYGRTGKSRSGRRTRTSALPAQR